MNHQHQGLTAHNGSRMGRDGSARGSIRGDGSSNPFGQRQDPTRANPPTAMPPRNPFMGNSDANSRTQVANTSINRSTTVPGVISINYGPSVETRSSVRETLKRAKDIFKSFDGFGNGHDNAVDGDEL
jgi:hypothetical protein